MTSDNGSGIIRSQDETKSIKGAVDCDWVIIGKPGSTLNLKFLTQDSTKALTRSNADVSNIFFVVRAN